VYKEQNKITNSFEFCKLSPNLEALGKWGLDEKFCSKVVRNYKN
jgi:hypothetical protein